MPDDRRTMPLEIHIYDKAKWHYGGHYPKDLPPANGFIHIGMFLGWLIDRGLVDVGFADDVPTELDEFRARTLTPGKLFERLDGALDSSMLSDRGNAFAQAYFAKRYIDDYVDAIPTGDTAYHAVDSWENFELVAKRLDARLATFEKDRGVRTARQAQKAAAARPKIRTTKFKKKPKRKPRR